MPARVSSQPEIFTVPPRKPVLSPEKKCGQLTYAEVEQYFKEGFLLIPDFFKKEELKDVISAVCELVDKLAERLYKAGKIKDKHENATFYERLTLIEKEFPGAAVLLHKEGVMPKAFQDLWTNERLLNVIEQFIGPEIAGHPVWNLRTKTPRNSLVTVPWHQDSGYLSADAVEVLQPTAWIPLLDTNKMNGCMQVARSGHKSGILATHTCCAGSSWYIDLAEEEMAKTLDSPLFFLSFSLENFSNKIRWSLDLRWQRPDKPNGFYGLKDNILLRSSEDPDYKVDWSVFASVDRTQLQRDHADVQSKLNKGAIEPAEDPDFDTTIVGPWMGQWEIVHHNKHTIQFGAVGEDFQSWHKA